MNIEMMSPQYNIVHLRKEFVFLIRRTSSVIEMNNILMEKINFISINYGKN